MRQNLILCLALVFLALASSGCGVTMRTQATSVPDLAVKPGSIFVVSNTPNLDKYMFGVGRKAAVRLVEEFQDRDIKAWSYDQGSLNLARKTVDDSLMNCEPEAVLVLVEKLGLVSKSWGSTSVKEFEIESSLMLPGSENVVWRARTTCKVEGSPSLRETYIKLTEQILVKLAAKDIVPEGHLSSKK